MKKITVLVILFLIFTFMSMGGIVLVEWSLHNVSAFIFDLLMLNMFGWIGLTLLTGIVIFYKLERN